MEDGVGDGKKPYSKEGERLENIDLWILQSVVGGACTARVF